MPNRAATKPSRACTRALRSGHVQGHELAAVYNNRCSEFIDKREYDRAIMDCGEAIRLEPNYTFPLNGRGNAYRAKGDADRAIADYNEAIRVNPK